jgi:hypothetical protein
MSYHVSGTEWIQLNYRDQKVAKDFIPGGTTLNDIGFGVVKRIHKEYEFSGSLTLERYKAPLSLAGQQSVATTRIQLTWYPESGLTF